MITMKKIVKQLFSAILFCAVIGGFASCDKEKKDTSPDPEPYKYEWDLDFPYEVYVSAGAAAQLEDSYSDFLTLTSNAITENTYMVILDKLTDLPAEQLVDLYTRGVVVAIVYPRKAEIEALFQSYPEMGYFLGDDSIDGSLLLALSGWNNGYYIIPETGKYLQNYSFETDHPVVPNPADAAAGEYDPDELPYYTSPEELGYDLSYYFFGAFLEDLLTEQWKYEAEQAETKAEKDNVADVKKMAGKAHVWAGGVFKINEVFFRTSYKFNGCAPVTVSYDIYPIHVYEEETGAGDYYFMDMTANVANDRMFQGKHSIGTSFFPVRLRYCGAYAKSFRVNSTLINSDNNEEVSGVSFPAEGFPFPETIIKQTNYSKTKSFNIGCGVSAKLGGEKGHEGSTETGGVNGGGSLSVNAGWSWSDTKSWTEKDVDVQNKTYNSTASWELAYNELPEFKFSEDCGFDLGRSWAYRSSMQLHGAWVWYVPDMPDDTDAKPFRIKVEAEGNYGFMKFWGTKADLDTYSWTCKFSEIKPMPKMVNFKAGNLVLKNNFPGKYISNIMVYNSKGQPLVPAARFQNSYPAGTDIKLGAYKCAEDLMVKFKMDGKTYKYTLNQYVKTVFKDEVVLYSNNDFTVEE